MKYFLVALLFVTAGAAQAASLETALETAGQTESFVEEYALDNFVISPESPLLQGIRPNKGGIYLDSATRTLRLVLQRTQLCRPGEPCPEARFATLVIPVVIELPVTYIGSPFCGGRVITAEQDLRRVDGGLTRIQVVDNNGNRCTGNADDITFVKRVKVTLTEEGARASSPEVSILSGFPFASER